MRKTDRLRAYKSYDARDITVTQSLTIQDWYQSIITRVGRINPELDLLSPPPGLSHDSDSMGSLNMIDDAHGLPLIEARGYASIREAERAMTNIAILVRNEARWFFS